MTSSLAIPPDLPLPILVTRPEPACGETAARLTSLGYDARVAPALVARPLPVRSLDIKDDLLVVTSPQAARFLSGWVQLHDRPVLAVGARTAALLRASGFQKVAIGGGTGAALARAIGDRAAVLLGAPTTGAALRAAAGARLWQENVYEVVAAAALPTAAVAALRDRPAIVLFYSARTAATFLQLAGDLAMGRHQAICLSDDIAAVARSGGFVDVLTAEHPTGAALEDALQHLPGALGCRA